MAKTVSPFGPLFGEFLKAHPEEIPGVWFENVFGLLTPRIDREAGAALLTWCIRTGKCAASGRSYEYAVALFESWVREGVPGE